MPQFFKPTPRFLFIPGRFHSGPRHLGTKEVLEFGTAGEPVSFGRCWSNDWMMMMMTTTTTTMMMMMIVIIIVIIIVIVFVIIISVMIWHSSSYYCCYYYIIIIYNYLRLFTIIYDL